MNMSQLFPIFSAQVFLQFSNLFQLVSHFHPLFVQVAQFVSQQNRNP